MTAHQVRLRATLVERLAQAVRRGVPLRQPGQVLVFAVDLGAPRSGPDSRLMTVGEAAFLIMGGGPDLLVRLRAAEAQPGPVVYALITDKTEVYTGLFRISRDGSVSAIESPPARVVLPCQQTPEETEAKVYRLAERVIFDSTCRPQLLQLAAHATEEEAVVLVVRVTDFASMALVGCLPALSPKSEIVERDEAGERVVRDLERYRRAGRRALVLYVMASDDVRLIYACTLDRVPGAAA